MNKIPTFWKCALATSCFLFAWTPAQAYDGYGYPVSANPAYRPQNFIQFSPRSTNTVPFTEGRANDLLASKELILLIDSSYSMGTHDCPGKGIFGKELSRWNWCREQTLHLGRTTPSVLRDGMDIITFTTKFKDWGHASLRDVEEIYKHNHPTGGTRLGGPLAYAIDRYYQTAGYQRRRPLLVVVITDGCPHDKDVVKNVLIEATQKAAYPGQVQVVFLQISDDSEGTHFLEKLTDRLVDKGARYPIVDTEPFEVVQHVGIKEALVEAVVHSQRS